jgi:hypothetical protein
MIDKKIKKAAYDRNRYLANKVEILAKQKIYNDVHKDALAARAKVRYVEKLDEITKYKKDWYQETKVRIGLKTKADYGTLHYCVTRAKSFKRMRDKWTPERLATMCRRLTRAMQLCGRLPTHKSCSVCGDTKKKIENHHPDYRKPTRYTPVCRKCHKIKFHPEGFNK